MLLSHVPLSASPLGAGVLGPAPVYISGSVAAKTATVLGLLSAVESVTEFSSVVVRQNRVTVSGLLALPVTMTGAAALPKFTAGSELWVSKVFSGMAKAKPKANGVFGTLPHLSGGVLIVPAVSSAVGVPVTLTGSPIRIITRTITSGIKFTTVFAGAVGYVYRKPGSSLRIGAALAGDAFIKIRGGGTMRHVRPILPMVSVRGGVSCFAEAIGTLNAGSTLSGSTAVQPLSASGRVIYPMGGSPRYSPKAIGNLGINVDLLRQGAVFSFSPMNLVLTQRRNQGVHCVL